MMTLTDFNADFKAAHAKLSNESGSLTTSVLTLCKVVADAKRTLRPYDWALFERHNGLSGEKNATRCRKMVTIGKRADTLLEFSEALPPSVSALFHLARLD